MEWLRLTAFVGVGRRALVSSASKSLVFFVTDRWFENRRSGLSSSTSLQGWLTAIHHFA